MTAPTRPGRGDRARRCGRVALVAAALALGTAVTVSTGPAAGDDPVPGVVAAMRARIDRMVATGTPADHPKVRMLRAEVAALVEGREAAARPEPEVTPRHGRDGGAPTDDPADARAQLDDVRPDRPIERGAVTCEPAPGRLPAAEVAGARCVTVPQDDGTARYVAVAPDGTVHVVGFAADGVARRPDRRLPDGVDARTVGLAPGDGGDLLLVGPAGAPVGRVDLG